MFAVAIGDKYVGISLVYTVMQTDPNIVLNHPFSGDMTLTLAEFVSAVARGILEPFNDEADDRDAFDGLKAKTESEPVNRPRNTVSMLVTVNLEDVPGFGYDGESWVNHVQTLLNNSVGHYEPKVTFLGVREPTVDEMNTWYDYLDSLGS